MLSADFKLEVRAFSLIIDATLFYMYLTTVAFLCLLYHMIKLAFPLDTDLRPATNHVDMLPINYY